MHYAPPQGELRPAFFKRLASHVTKNTIMGIDANCVPDVTFDVEAVASLW
jgi:hypothetical protein